MHIASFDVAVRTGEIHIFHCTHSMTLCLGIELAADAVMVESNDFTRLHIADILSSEHIESASLTCHHISFTKLTDSERMESVLVSASIDTASCHNHECKGTVNLIQRLLESIDTRQFTVNALLLDKMRQHLCI